MTRLSGIWMLGALGCGCLVVPLCGCEDPVSCTLMGCMGSFPVSVRPASDAVPIELGEVYRVEFGFAPRTEEEPEQVYFTDCTIAVGHIDCMQSQDIPVDGVGTIQAGADQLGFIKAEVTLPSAETYLPSRIRVSVTRDGTLLGEDTFDPSYQPVYANGPGCGVTCWDAATTSLEI